MQIPNHQAAKYIGEQVSSVLHRRPFTQTVDQQELQTAASYLQDPRAWEVFADHYGVKLKWTRANAILTAHELVDTGRGNILGSIRYDKWKHDEQKRKLSELLLQTLMSTAHVPDILYNAIKECRSPASALPILGMFLYANSRKAIDPFPIETSLLNEEPRLGEYLVFEQAIMTALAPLMREHKPHVILLGPGESYNDIWYAKRFLDCFKSLSGQYGHLDIYDIFEGSIFLHCQMANLSPHTCHIYADDSNLNAGDFTKSPDKQADLVIRIMPATTDSDYNEQAYHFQRFLRPGGLAIVGIQSSAMGADPYFEIMRRYTPFFTPLFVTHDAVLTTPDTENLNGQLFFVLQRTNVPRPKSALYCENIQAAVREELLPVDTHRDQSDHFREVVKEI